MEGICWAFKRIWKRSPEHLFKEWQDWYGFGSMMNLPMNRLETEYEIDSNDKYAVLQKDF